MVLSDDEHACSVFPHERSVSRHSMCDEQIDAVTFPGSMDMRARLGEGTGCNVREITFVLAGQRGGCTSILLPSSDLGSMICRGGVVVL